MFLIILLIIKVYFLLSKVFYSPGKSESLDPVDEAILNLTSEKTKRDSLSNFTSDDLFYLSISRDTQQLNIRDKMRLKQTVLNTLSEILNNNSIIE